MDRPANRMESDPTVFDHMAETVPPTLFLKPDKYTDGYQKEAVGAIGDMHIYIKNTLPMPETYCHQVILSNGRERLELITLLNDRAKRSTLVDKPLSNVEENATLLLNVFPKKTFSLRLITTKGLRGKYTIIP